MTALDLVRKIRANPRGSDFQDVKLVEEFVKVEVDKANKELLLKLKVHYPSLKVPDDL